MNIFDGYPVSCILWAHGSLFFNSTPMYYYLISSSHLSFIPRRFWTEIVLFCSPYEFYVLFYMLVTWVIDCTPSISCMIYLFLFLFLWYHDVHY
ncbi:hypothetical protein BDV40DRAFT_268038 [Aspergillus tamarii]|uniref:Uncharacterized protein n=1 Tax=Aspergillus tamarii TaxID=41984 RepID=A0A5N6URS2_ASPTM|nr:hypothetical protein BDV40DRAFT_268038 [Aspergillus tamarii]